MNKQLKQTKMKAVKFQIELTKQELTDLQDLTANAALASVDTADGLYWLELYNKIRELKLTTLVSHVFEG